MDKKTIYVYKPAETYDAIVIGSGISGGWAAKELTEKGFKTLLLERGHNVEHGKDYITEHLGPWQMEFRGQGDRKRYKEDYPGDQPSMVINEYNYHFFATKKAYPYQTDMENPCQWVRGYQVGGRSLTWGRQSYRWSNLDFEANLKEGVGVDWPIRYEDIAPWYDYVEEFIGVTGRQENLPQLPDGKFLPPMEMNCLEKYVKKKIETNFEYRCMTIGRAAILTRPHNGRGQCHYCGPCSRGCSVGAYFSSQSSTLPAAVKTGNLTLRPNSIVHSIIYDKNSNRASGVRVIDRITRETQEFFGKVIFLNASTLGSTQILLNSKSETFPSGIANSSGVLGHYLMDHHHQVGASAMFEGFEDKYYFGTRPNGIYIPRFRNINEKTKRADFVRGYGYQGMALRSTWERGETMKGFGEDFKRKLRDPGHWSFFLMGFGEILPYYDNGVELSPELTDEWGIPQLVLKGSIKANELAMRKDMAEAAAEMLDIAGGKDVTTFDDEYRLAGAIHEMGTARMGHDPKTSYLNSHNQSHDVPNLFVTDGACMTSTGFQNPSLTYMALTARAVDYAVSALKKGQL